MNLSGNNIMDPSLSWSLNLIFGIFCYSESQSLILQFPSSAVNRYRIETTSSTILRKSMTKNILLTYIACIFVSFSSSSGAPFWSRRTVTCSRSIVFWFQITGTVFDGFCRHDENKNLTDRN